MEHLNAGASARESNATGTAKHEDGAGGKSTHKDWQRIGGT